MKEGARRGADWMIYLLNLFYPGGAGFYLLQNKISYSIFNLNNGHKVALQHVLSPGGAGGFI